MVTNDEKTLALLSHVLCFVGGVFAPLIVWMLKKDSSYYVAEHAKESLNFQLSSLIYLFVAGMLCFVLIGFIILPIIGIFMAIVIIIASIKSYNGEQYRYPLCIRFIK